MALEGGEIDKERILIISKENELDITGLANTEEALFSKKKTPAPMSFSDGGEYLTVLDEGGVEVISMRAGTPERAVYHALEKLRFAWLSPKANFLCTLEKLDKSNKGTYKNLKVWRMSDNTVVKSFNAPNFTNRTHKIIKWSSDDSLFGVHVSRKEILFFDSTSFALVARLTRRNIINFELNGKCGAELRVAVCTQHDASNPGSCEMLTYPEFEKICSKSFYGADEIDVSWNSQGNSFLARVFTEVDETGKSYYGKSRMIYMSSISQLASFLTPEKEGQIHDYSWNPRGNRFVIIAGSGSPLAIVYNMECRPVFNLGSRKFNSLSWSPQGRFFCLYASGSIGGANCEVWECKKRDQYMQIAKCENSGNIHAITWSPRGNSFVTATLSPNLRVDNGFKLWKINGEMLLQKEYDVLTRIQFYAKGDAEFPDPGPSNIKPIMGTKSADIEAIEVEKSAQKSKYVPPHMRNQVKAETTKVKVDKDFLPRKIVTSVGLNTSIQSDQPIGAGRRRKRNKDRKAKNDVNALSEPIQEPKQAEEDEKQVQSEETVEKDVLKQIRALKKKIRQVEKLKQDMQNGVVLNDDQTKKLGTEKSLLHDLEVLSMNQ